MNKLFITIIILFSLSGCVTDKIDPLPEDGSRRFLKVDDIGLFYGITIPESYQAEKPVPLVLALHYGGSFTDYYGRSFARQLVEPGFEHLGAIIISPTCPWYTWTTEISERAVLGLIDHIRSEYSIDEKRILVTGFSLGGAGTWHFAAKFPEIFSIAVPIAGPVRDFTPEFLKKIKIPVYVIHSRDDEVVPFDEVEEMVNLLIYNGVYIEFRILEGMYHFQTSEYSEFLQEAVPWIFTIWDSY